MDLIKYSITLKKWIIKAKTLMCAYLIMLKKWSIITKLNSLRIIKDKLIGIFSTCSIKNYGQKEIYLIINNINHKNY